jgi:hypothetical protein
MSTDVLALVVTDDRLGYNVIDSRCGLPISWHGDLLDANGIAAYLNSTYPVGGADLSSGKFCAPARDTLIHEVLCRRVGGDDPTCIETWCMLNPLRCPWGVPTGPGWDHIHKAVRS